MKLRTQLLLGYLVVFSLMIAITAVMYQNSRSLLETQQWVEHTHEVNAKVRLVQKLVIDMQTGKRGYLITGREIYLQPYNAAIEAYDKETSALRDLISDNPLQIERLNEIKTVVTRWQKTVAIPHIEKRREVKRGAAAPDEVAALMEKDIGMHLMKDIHDKVNEFDSMEDNLLMERQKAVKVSLRNTTFMAIFGILIAIAFGFATMVLVTRGILRQVGGEPSEIAKIADRIAQGNLDMLAPRNTEGVTGIHASMRKMLLALRSNKEKEMRQNQALRQLSSELEMIIDSIPGLVFYKDTENRYIWVNKYVADAHKMTKEQLEGKSLYDIYPRELAEAYFKDDREVIESRTAKLNIDEPWETERGTRWVNTSKIPYMDEKRQVIGIIVVSIDITERKQAENDARYQSEQVERKTKVLNAINRILREALTCKTEEEVAKTALSVAEEVTGSRFGFIMEINPAGLMDTIAISNPGWQACDVIVSEAKNFIKNMPLRGIDRTILKEGTSRIINADRMATHPDRVGTPKGHPSITCFLGVPFKRKGKTVGMIGLANRKKGYTIEDQDAVESVSVVFHEALVSKRAEIEIERQNQIKTGQSGLSDIMRGDFEIATLCQNIITYLCKYLKVQTGLIYLAKGDGSLRLVASYAHKTRQDAAGEYRPGEGLVGQAALNRKEMLIANVPQDYIKIESGLGEAAPRCIHLKPIVHNDRVTALLELGTLHEFGEFQSEFLNTVAESIALTIESTESRTNLSKSLEVSQRLSEELQAQQEELRTFNDELEEQTQKLQASDERLRKQQEELRVTNEELEEKNEMLKRQKREVEQARRVVEEKAGELAIASKYKSQFLATMSHELRSPLNSLLLLAQWLAQNKDGNLTDEQVESAKVIYVSGTDLLNLINEILDISKIEAGRMELQLGTVRVSDLADGIRASFGQLAEEKGLKLEVAVSEDAPAEITSDRKRVEQVIRNLVSNAVKFTKEGSVTVTFGHLSLVNGHWEDGKGKMVDLRVTDDHSRMPHESLLKLSVSDTGIGIAAEKHKIVFEAFQQANGGTARKYGGTGLGLSISRKLANLLGGEIRVESQEGKGSRFTLYLPIEILKSKSKRRDLKFETPEKPFSDGQFQVSSFKSPASIPDDRESLEQGDKVILVIEDDSNFAKVLYNKCHERAFKCLAATTGEAGLKLAGKHLPDGIMLDIRLPGMDGWAVLDALKDNIRTRHIPVHVVSVDKVATESLRKGAIGHTTKPLNHEELDHAFKKIEATAEEKTKRVLLVEDDDQIRRSVKQLIGNGDVEVDEAATGELAIKALHATKYGCLILDLRLPDMDGSELLKRMEAEGIELPPVIVHTARELTEQEEMGLREHAESIVIKDARSHERLLDEVSLFLHRMVSKMPERKKQMIRNLHETDVLLKDKKVLVVDDDMRTTFALSRLLSERGMKPLKAGNGEQALQVLDHEPDVDLVLMDIMMPVMDGYEAIRRIRNSELATRKVPIIVLTAKVMPEDRQTCIEAGANDYLPKPLDQERLISMLRVWLYR